jgi:hypothetical protein
MLRFQKNIKPQKNKISQKGQTTVEFVLLVAVISIVALGFFRQLEGYLINNPNSLVNTYLSSFSTLFGSDRAGSGVNGRYKTYRLKR